MTDLEISKDLARAIGWHDVSCTNDDGELYLWVSTNPKGKRYKLFDYRDWAVIGPIAERFDCFPAKGYENSHTPWEALSTEPMELVRADTPQKAIALAVIRTQNRI